MGIFVCNVCNTEFGPFGGCPKCSSLNVSCIKEVKNCEDFKNLKQDASEQDQLVRT